MKEPLFNRILFTLIAGGLGLILLKHLDNAQGFGLMLIAIAITSIAMLIKYMWYERA